MENFVYHNPTKLVFGKGQIETLTSLIPTHVKSLLITYGGGSIKANGTYDKVLKALQPKIAEGLSLIEFGGIEANPEFETCLKAVQICEEQNIDFILAVGGGSVLDASKFIAAATKFPQNNKWQIIEKAGSNVEAALPIGAVMTLPATGSEANPNAVISRRTTGEKLYFGSSHVYPTFSILDPETTYSLPTRQTLNGIVDAFIHIMEQYATFPVGAAVQDRQAEALLSVLIETGPELLKNPQSYEHRANLMWAATQALNGQIGLGVPNDWATHGIGHELTAFFGLDHAQTLAVVWPGLVKNRLENKQAKLAQYGRRVWGLQGETTQVALEAISKTESFFESLGCPTRLSAYKVDAGVAAEKICTRFKERGLSNESGIGEKGDITLLEIEKILLDRQ